MASFVGNTLGKVLKPALTWNPGRNQQIAQNLAGKGYRAAIFFSKKAEDNISSKPEDKEHRKIIGRVGEAQSGLGYSSEPANQRTARTHNAQKVYLLDYDFKPAKHKQSRVVDRIELSSIPHEIEYDPETKLVALYSIGRNNPRYHYTGAEDTVEMELDWYARTEHMQEVIFKCRWLEAMSKNDSYQESLHRLMVIWGNDNQLLQDDLFLVESAKYTLSNWNTGYMSGEKFVSTGMLPKVAKQKLVLKRVSDKQRSSADIIGSIGRNVKLDP